MNKMKCTLLVLLLGIVQFEAKAQEKKLPKLVVGIVVDQMRYDYIYKYWDCYSEQGFKRLVNEGYFCRNVNYNYVPTYTAPGHASIYTGTTPATHGIISNNWFDRKSKTDIYCTTDNAYKTIGSSSTAGQMSPKNLLTTTITDELRLSNNKRSKVIGIALKDRGAILPAGHMANAAYWYDGMNGNFISSSYYMNDLPVWVKDFNKMQLAKKFLSQPWTLALGAEKYAQSLADDNKYEGPFKSESRPVFPHNLPELMKDNGGLGLLKSTPFGNTITKEFAIQSIRSENLGKGAFTDFITISFSSTDYIGHQFGPGSMEMQDTYIRLDKDIADLLSFLDSYLGANNVLLFLTADHAGLENAAYLGDEKVTAGYFESEHPIDSLKNYLFKNYGDSLVLDFSNDQVFLNREKIAEKKLVLAQIQNEVAEFMMRFRGVSNALTATTLVNSEFTKGVRMRMQLGYNQKRSGDVLINYQPAWVEFTRTGTTHGSPYSYDTHVPLLIFGNNIKPGSTSEPIDITDLAPTIAQFLNIQFPNGCSGNPIQSLVK